MITNSNSIRSTLRFSCGLVMALLLAGVVTGCTTMSSYIPFMGKKKQQETFVKNLWNSGEQFVAIEKQDRQQGVVVRPNQHITEISVERVRVMLESMELRSTGKDKNMPLFNEDEIKILSEYIPVGLALSGPDEDVTFAVIGLYVEAMGGLKKREVSTGRVFYQDGRINIIFGDIHRELKEEKKTVASIRSCQVPGQVRSVIRTERFCPSRAARYSQRTARIGLRSSWAHLRVRPLPRLTRKAEKRPRR
jgi:hypothetical protein